MISQTLFRTHVEGLDNSFVFDKLFLVLQLLLKSKVTFFPHYLPLVITVLTVRDAGDAVIQQFIKDIALTLATYL